MARIRTLKPGFFKSRSLSKLPRDVRLTFAGLWCEADDHGRGVADARLLKGALWPLDDDITFLHVSAHLDMLAASSHIRLYEVGDEAFYEVVKWEEHQAAAYRRGDAKYPPLSAGQELSQLSVRENASGTQTSAGIRNREQGTGKHISRPAEPIEEFDDFNLDEPLTDPTYDIGSDDDPKFREFWAAVPKKDGKAEARSAWSNHVQGKGTYKGQKIAKADPDVIIAGMLAYAERVRRDGTERKHIKMAEGWLNGRRWEDEQRQQQEQRPVQGAWSSIWD